MVKRDKKNIGKEAMHPRLGLVTIAAFRDNDLDGTAWVLVTPKGFHGSLPVKASNLTIL